MKIQNANKKFNCVFFSRFLLLFLSALNIVIVIIVYNKGEDPSISPSHFQTFIVDTYYASDV